MGKKTNRTGIPKNLAAKLSGIISPQAPKDVDPENALFKDGAVEGMDSDEESEDSEAGREHYIEVGMSKLRNQLDLPIDDPKYKGKTKSRAQIFDMEDSEEDESNDNEEEEEINQSEEGDLEGSASEEKEEEELEKEDSIKNEISEGESDEDLEELSIGNEINEEDSNEDSGEDDEYSDGLGDGMDEVDDFDAELTKELKEAAEEEKELLSNLNKKSVDDATKGKYIKEQLSVWESSLDLRIRFQKLLQMANQLPQDDELLKQIKEQGVNKNKVDETSKGLVDLINELVTIRKNFLPKNTEGQEQLSVPSKRSHGSVQLDDIWNNLSTLNEAITPYRRTTLEKWNNKVRASDGGLIASSKKFKALDQSILTQINNVLADPQRLLDRCHIKRSQYLVIGKKKETEVDNKKENNVDEEIYDDGDFYQQLLKEFIDSRMVDTDNQEVTSGLRWAALKQTKQAKNKVVDTKASKGRKLRFHVHDKLVSFMVPIPTQKWHPEMVDELYTSLFSQNKAKKANKEDEPVNDGLRIFG